MSKITYKKLYTEFKKTHPLMNKSVMGWFPYGSSQIQLWMNDGSIIIYNDETNRITRTFGRWKD